MYDFSQTHKQINTQSYVCTYDILLFTYSPHARTHTYTQFYVCTYYVWFFTNISTCTRTIKCVHVLRITFHILSTYSYTHTYTRTIICVNVLYIVSINIQHIYTKLCLCTNYFPHARTNTYTHNSMCVCIIYYFPHTYQKKTHAMICVETKIHTQSNLKKIYTRNYMCANIK